MKIRELVTGIVYEDYVNPHPTPEPGVVPSFAGGRAPNMPGSPMPLTPPMSALPGRSSMAAPTGAPGAMAQNTSPDQINPHAMSPGTVPSFAGPRPPTMPSAPPTPGAGPTMGGRYS